MARLSELQANETGENTAAEIKISSATWSDYKSGIQLPKIQNNIKIIYIFLGNLAFIEREMQGN